MLHSAGGDPATLILGARADPESLAGLRQELGLDRPLLVQYAAFLGGAVDSRGKQVENMVHAFQMNLTVLSGVGLLVGIFLIYNSVSFSVIQRRREIGIFRAIGMSTRTVSVLFVGEAAAMGWVGGLLGALLGVWTATALTELLGRTVT
jgi:ABC-type antimicrobial peptide transport system permease subunit